MQRAQAPSVRRLARAGILALLTFGATAVAEPRDKHDQRRLLAADAYEDDGWSGALQFTFDGDGWYGYAPTGGVSFLDTSGGDGLEIAKAFGYAVHPTYGGGWIAEPAGSVGPMDWIFLSQVIDGSDPWADAEPDYFLRAPEGSQSNGVILPSDFGRAQFLRQPAFAAVHAKAAHRLGTGAGRRIAVLDTGVDWAHQELFGRVDARSGWDFVDDDPSALPEEDPDDKADEKSYGHGTAVAGLALAAAPAATIVPVRVLDERAVGTTARLAAGIRWAVDQDADVVNMSLGGGPRTTAVQEAIREGQDRGVLFVAAAGRNEWRTDYPASEWGVVAVFGAGGAPGDMWAPASRVIGPYPRGRWFRGTGTSFATALTAGGAALALERRPGIDPYTLIHLLVPGRNGKPRLDLVRLAQ